MKTPELQTLTHLAKIASELEKIRIALEMLNENVHEINKWGLGPA